MILARGLSLAAIGLALGLISSFMLTRFLAHMLFSVQPFDAITFVAAATLLLAVSALASLAPAWLASRIDPIGTLRNQ
jgi:putative ABC transport system permease protein